MKKSVKIILSVMLFGAMLLNLSIDAHGNLSLTGSKVVATETHPTLPDGWKAEEVDCLHPETNEVYATAIGCFLGEDEDCNPTSCPPAPKDTGTGGE